MELRLFDTYTRSVRHFSPLDPPKVGMYACGPTVYDHAHIGNLRTYLFEDILRRSLEYAGYEVTHVVNLTDVGHLLSDSDDGEDRMEVGSRRTGKSAWEIAELYTQEFKRDLERLNILEPHIWCRATDHIPEQIQFIQRIEARGYSYRAADGIYFDTSKLPDYGHLARPNPAGLQIGARVRESGKRNPTDFALWRLSRADENRQMEWPSPWGVGFPGWSIECSAMSAKYLGPFFDIHCGGEDHIMVHHPNEIAQTQACHGTQLANFWMHGYFLQIDSARMGKSVGNFLRLESLVERGFDPLVWRFYCLGAHYRSKLNFTWDGLTGAATALDRMRRAAHSWGPAGTRDDQYRQRFAKCVGDDLNMPRVLALAWELVRSDLPGPVKKATLLEFDRVLGLGLAAWRPTEADVPETVRELVSQREAARADKRWADADALRESVLALGYELDDAPGGTIVRKVSAAI